MKPFRVGLIGCGRISDIYIRTCQSFPELEIAVCGALDRAESAAKAALHGIPRVATPEDILADPTIDVILNLTVPAAHARISLAALEQGKHVYSEKPFVTSLDDGARILERAREKGLLVGNAPDTFLGARLQTARRAMDEGLIGTPTGAMVFVGTHGTERHNPNPDFYYQKGGGPLLDLGPYYLTALVFLMGPIVRVAGMSRRTFATRMIENGPRSGESIGVDVDTHSQGMMEFASDAIASMTMSFDVWDSDTPRMEIYGEEGTLCLPDPDPVHGANVFGGPLWLRQRDTARWTHQPRPDGRDHWQVLPPAHGFAEDSRGLGLLDLAYAARDGRAVRASGELAFHVFEVMDAMARAAASGCYQPIRSRCAIPEPLPPDFPASEHQRDFGS